MYYKYLGVLWLVNTDEDLNIEMSDFNSFVLFKIFTVIFEDGLA